MSIQNTSLILSVVNLELGKLAFQITGIPEHHMIEKFSPHRPSRVSDERQPRGPGAGGCGAMVFRQPAIYDVLVDVDPERVRDDARDQRTAEPVIARLELDDGLDEYVASAPSVLASSGTGSTRAVGGTCDAATPDETPGASSGASC
jgi:hypothetical protein